MTFKWLDDPWIFVSSILTQYQHHTALKNKQKKKDSRIKDLLIFDCHPTRIWAVCNRCIVLEEVWRKNHLFFAEYGTIWGMVSTLCNVQIGSNCARLTAGSTSGLERKIQTVWLCRCTAPARCDLQVSKEVLFSLTITVLDYLYCSSLTMPLPTVTIYGKQ